MNFTISKLFFHFLLGNKFRSGFFGFKVWSALEGIRAVCAVAARPNRHRQAALSENIS